MDVLLTAATGAGNSKAVTVGLDAGAGGVNIVPPVTLALIGAGGSDHIKLQYYDGTDWRDVVVGTATVQLDANNTVLYIDRPMTFRVSKGVTTATIGAGMYRGKGV